MFVAPRLLCGPKSARFLVRFSASAFCFTKLLPGILSVLHLSIRPPRPETRSNVEVSSWPAEYVDPAYRYLIADPLRTAAKRAPCFAPIDTHCPTDWQALVSVKRRASCVRSIPGVFCGCFLIFIYGSPISRTLRWNRNHDSQRNARKPL